MLSKKHVFISLILVLFVIGNVFAQETGQFSIGARAGVLIGFHSIPSDFLLFAITLGVDSSWQSKNNFNFAIYGSYAITDRILIQPEFNFMIKQGYKGEISGLSSEVDAYYSSLDIPILVKYTFLKQPLFFGILAGPHLSFPLGDLKMEVPGYLTSVGDSDGVAFGFSAGLFGGYPVGPGRIVGDLRFIMDFNSIGMKESGVSFEMIKRRGISFTIGYEYSF